MNAAKLEICLDSVASAVAAEAGGAARVELCDNLMEGGTTPSEGMIRVVRKRIEIGLQVIIRPRGGNFCYSEDEYAVMAADVRRAKELGADGIVVGMLNADGTVDRDRCARLRELAYPLNATFHRAFDVSVDGDAALETVIALGFDRILTSGLAPTVWQGLDRLTHLVNTAGDRIIIMPGGDLTEDTIGRCRAATGAREFHMMANKPVAASIDRRRWIPMGGVLRPPEDLLHVTDQARVQASVAAIATAAPSTAGARKR